MAIHVENNVVRLEISEDNVLLVQVLESQHDLRSVDSCSIYGKPTLISESHAHVTAWCIVHNQVEPALALKGEV